MQKAKSMLLNKLVQDTIVWGLEKDNALAYIKHYYNIPNGITEGHYNRVKKFVNSEPDIRNFLSEQAMVGHARIHKTQIEELTRLKQVLLNQFFIESQKPDLTPKIKQNDDGSWFTVMKSSGKVGSDGKYVMEPVLISNWDKSKQVMIALTREIDNINKSLDDLHNSTPVVMAIRKKLNQELEDNNEVIETGIKVSN